MRPVWKKHFTAGLFFASFVFLQFLILRMGNGAGRGFLPQARQDRVYVFLQIAVICGILLHALLQKRFRNVRGLRGISLCALGLCLAGAGVMLFAPADGAAYLAVTFLTVFCLGFVAGAVYLRIGQYAAAGYKVGICLGGGYSAALLVQFFLQLQWEIKPALAPLALAACGVLAAGLWRGAPEKEQGSAERVRPQKILFACVIAAALLLFPAFYNGYIHHLQVATGYTVYNVYAWPRLLMIPGVLAFGAAGEYKKGKFLPLAALCFSVVALLNGVLAGRSETYWLNMCLYYIALSAGVSYYNITFWKLAPGTDRPALWSAAGRVLDSVIVIPLCLVPLTEASAGAVLAMNVAALAVLIVVMAMNGDLAFSSGRPQTEGPLPNVPLSEDEALSSVAERYRLTPSEFRVFRFLVLTEDKQAAIAEKLSIKLRTVQANVTSIYRKTGVTTRAGLLQIYHDVQK